MDIFGQHRSFVGIAAVVEASDVHGVAARDIREFQSEVKPKVVIMDIMVVEHTEAPILMEVQDQVLVHPEGPVLGVMEQEKERIK
ncbi:MAG: hypothetical protein J6O23_00810 [Prevotella sp.]|nr:hypothetical protein [Prevotella sp.]